MLKEILNKFPEELHKGIIISGQCADELGYQAFLVGGCVRDMILGVRHFDIDIVVEKDAIILAREVKRHLSADIVEHRRFGTATISFPQPKKRGETAQFKIDFATARSENYESPAELPKVSFSDIRADLFRRDFTINSLAVQINKTNFGQLIDYFNGVDDLQKGLIRVLHNLSFLDDPTRIIRAIRFEQRFNFKIEPHTRLLMRKALKFNIFSKLNEHRLRDELILLFKETEPEKCIKRMNVLCGLNFVCPKIKFSISMIKLFSSVKEKIRVFEDNFPHKRPLEPWLIYFMAFLNNLESREVIDICGKFSFRRGETLRILSYFSGRKRILAKLKDKGSSPSSIYKLLEPLSYEAMIILLANCRNKKIENKIMNFLLAHNGLKLNISGSDIKSLGLKPGPNFKNLLQKVLYEKIDGNLRSREEELLYLKKIALRYGNRIS